jgi:hypothetical protein
MSLPEIKNNKCPLCDEKFNTKRDVYKHIKKRTENCKKIEAILAKKSAQIVSDYEQRINILQEKNKKVVESLVHSKPGVKERRKVVENLESDSKILNFEKVVQKTEIPRSVLRNTVELMADGDVILFKRIFIEHVPPHLRCIRVKDFGRDKYEYFDGSVWVTTTLTYIIEQFANQLHSKYKFMVFEKYNAIEEIDSIYSPVDDAEKNAAEVDEITVRYAKVTEHVTKLGIHETDFINEIKRGVRGLLAQTVSGPKKEKNTSVPETEPFVYNEDIPDSIEVSEEADSDSDTNADSSKPDSDKLLPILQILGFHLTY